MPLPPEDDEPRDNAPIINEPPISKSDTRPLKPLGRQPAPSDVPSSAEDSPPPATILREAGSASPPPARRPVIGEDDDTNRVRLIPRIPAPPPWRVIFVVGGSQVTTIGLDVRQPLVIGRADGDHEQPDPDLDLTSHLALEHGVSRQHAVLIPSADGLYLADLGSTNGTWVNGQFVGPGERFPLSVGDRVEFGLLRLVVRSVAPLVRSSA